MINWNVLDAALALAVACLREGGRPCNVFAECTAGSGSIKVCVDPVCATEYTFRAEAVSFPLYIYLFFFCSSLLDGASFAREMREISRFRLADRNVCADGKIKVEAASTLPWFREKSQQLAARSRARVLTMHGALLIRDCTRTTEGRSKALEADRC